MDYQKIYTKLCERGQTPRPLSYSERHHIIPRCLNGTNDALNISILTGKEHFLAHRLLCKINPSEPKLKFALLMMMCKTKNSKRDYIVTARLYEQLRIELHAYRKSKPGTFQGRTHTLEAKEKNRLAHLGKKASPETIAKIIKANTGRRQTAYQKATVAKALAKTWTVTDPYGKAQTITNLRQFCRANGLDQGNMHKVASGRLPHSQGWTCRRLG